MGTYKSIKIDVNAYDQETLNLLKQEFTNDPDGDDGIMDFCFRKFSHQTKWWADPMVTRISKKMPNLTFRLTCRGSESSANFDIFVKNGESFNVDFVMPPKFPSISQWKLAQKKAKAYEEKTKEEAQKKAKEQEEHKLKRLAIEVERKQQELNALKNKISL